VTTPEVDVLVVGGGPAGRALAGQCAQRGLRTTLVDPTPDAPWRVTYGCWAADLPAGLPAAAVAARAQGRAIALTARPLGWEYAVLDVPALRAHLDAGMARAGVAVRTGRVAGVSAPGTAELTDGTRIRAGVVVDAGGRRQPLREGTRSGPPAADQTAYGVIVDEGLAAPFVAPGEALFMDWRRDHGEPGWPTFLYAVPLGQGAVLLEETSLARRPGLPLPDLRRRLTARLARHGIASTAGWPVERVRFPVDTPRHRSRRAVGFGAAAPLVHPASGFSVAAALRLAPDVAAAIADHLPAGREAALAAARRVVWPPPARLVHLLRRRGLEALLRMPPAEVPAFFEVFFDLPAHHRWAYLTARDDLSATMAAMNALFGRASWVLRGRLVGPALRPPLRANAEPATRPG
jgi:lycopene beta-cyclase